MDPREPQVWLLLGKLRYLLDQNDALAAAYDEFPFWRTLFGKGRRAMKAYFDDGLLERARETSEALSTLIAEVKEDLDVV